MASFYPSITDEQAALIQSAAVFFVATADPRLAWGPQGEGPVNVSPRGGVPLHILSPSRVAFLDYAGSGNETARHSLAGGPITLMVCSFGEDDAAIVRLYGTASVTPLADSPLAALLLERPAEEIKLPLRQVVEVEVERTMTSCGYGVPVMSFARDRRSADRGRRYKESRRLAKA
ncbi:MAG: pyridoxamine 5'-phosphate oxidase family protein [Kouleothrix sp.]|nr:pyridoxamine 5'-phosphate oxidase family protein [Kouleothrix sp.]